MERIEEVRGGLVREGVERKADIEIWSGSTWRESVSHIRGQFYETSIEIPWAWHACVFPLQSRMRRGRCKSAATMGTTKSRFHDWQKWCVDDDHTDGWMDEKEWNFIDLRQANILKTDAFEKALGQSPRESVGRGCRQQGVQWKDQLGGGARSTYTIVGSPSYKRKLNFFHIVVQVHGYSDID